MHLSCSKQALVKLLLSATAICNLLFFFFSFILSSLFGHHPQSSDEDEEDAETEVDGECLEVETVGLRSEECRSSSYEDTCQFDDSFQMDRFEGEDDEDSYVVEELEGSYVDEGFEHEIEFYKLPPSVVKGEWSKKQDYSSTKEFQHSPGKHEKRSQENKHGGEEVKFSVDEKFLIFSPPVAEKNTLQHPHKSHCNGDDDDNNEKKWYDEFSVVGSASKSSSEWMRRSASQRDSEKDNRFMCSSMRSSSCRAYHEVEMPFLDRTIGRKLHDTESLQVEPESIAQRLAPQLVAVKRKKVPTPNTIYDDHDPYGKLESTYLADVCRAWESLSWSYNNFRHKQALRKKQGMVTDPGCPAHVAGQFQQFQVLLQRYIENEPYECGKRPEVYSRMKRSVATKLLLVPHYQDCEDEGKEEGASSRVSSASFLNILEKSIRTFMRFLRADKESPCHALRRTLFARRRRRGAAVDPTLVDVIKRTNNKKKVKLKDIKRAGKCMRRKKLTREEEMEILVGLVDLKVLSRVLRMRDLTHDQLRWCEEKMTKLTFTKQGKFHRDSSLLFFPPH